MHKGRENANGTFSIGKTWSLDDLSRVESFTNVMPQTPEQQQNKQRAGATGFLITIGKPYYWQAATAKEKEFFIFSLIKIFRKYTGGKLPELIGFNSQELDQLGGPTMAQVGAQPRSITNGGSGNGTRAPSQGPPPIQAPRADVPPLGMKVPSQDPLQSRSRHPDIPPPAARIPSQDPPLSRALRPDIPPSASRVPSQDSSSSRALRSDIAPPGSRIASQGPPPPRVNRPDGPPHDINRERRNYPSQDRETQERPLHSAVQQEHRVLHSAASRERSLRTAGSNDRIHMPGSFPSTDSIPSQISQSQLRSKRSASPGSYASSVQPNISRAPSESRNLASSQYEQDQLSVHSAMTGRSSSEQSRQNGVYPPGDRFRDASQQRSESADERPRTAGRNVSVPPALAIRDPRHQNPTSPNDLGSQSDHSNYAQTPRIIPSESMNGDTRTESRQGRYTDRDYGALNQAHFAKNRSTSDVRSAKPPILDNSTDQPMQNPITTASNTERSIVSAPSSTLPPTPPPEVPPEPEAHRPGLGPMIKKKSNKEIASQFRKAATTYNAFQPRAGSAADKTQDENTSSGDGITGVFQAPSLIRRVSQDDPRPSTPVNKADTRPSTPDQKTTVPSVSVASSPAKPVAPSTEDPSKLREVSLQESEIPAAVSKLPVPAQDERRKKRQSDHSAKYAKSMGIAPSLLEGRTIEIDAVLNDFGWGEESNKTTFEDLQSGIRKELARVEAGSWLGAVENSDDRTTAVSNMMDKVMAECEELDCLLTLYHVELGVSRHTVRCWTTIDYL